MLHEQIEVFLKVFFVDMIICEYLIFNNFTETKWKMYIFVKSKAENIERRKNIRRTWGSVFYINGGELATIFVIGKPNNIAQKKIDEEFQRYGDVLQIGEDDGYQ